MSFVFVLPDPFFIVFLLLYPLFFLVKKMKDDLRFSQTRENGVDLIGSEHRVVFVKIVPSSFREM